MNLKDKHVFIIGDRDKFFYLQADALINKVGISPDSICAVVLKLSEKEDNYETLKKIDSVNYLKYYEGIVEDIVNAKTITAMSLSSYSSWFINEIIKYDKSILDKLYIFLTDDEVDRWGIVYKKNGKLIPDNEMYITIDDIDILSNVKNMIAPKSIFKPIINEILNRDINFVDAGVIFSTMSLKKALIFQQLYSSSNSLKPIKILYNTKQLPRKSVRRLFRLFSYLQQDNITVILFTQSTIDILMLVLIRFYFLKFKKKKITINYLSSTDPVTYSAILMSCSHIVLQDRGGASAAKYFSLLGQGVLCIKDGSFNQIAFCKKYNLDIFTYNTEKELAELINKKTVDLNKNKIILNKFELNWIKNYKKIYC